MVAKEGFLTQKSCHKEDTIQKYCWILLWLDMIAGVCTVIFQLCWELTWAQSQGNTHGKIGSKHSRTEEGNNLDP